MSSDTFDDIGDGFSKGFKSVSRSDFLSQQFMPGTTGYIMNRIQSGKDKAAKQKEQQRKDNIDSTRKAITTSKEIDEETRAELLKAMGEHGGDFQKASNLFKEALTAPNNSLSKMRLSRQRYLERQGQMGQTILTAPTAANPNAGTGSDSPFSTLLG